ncbi:cytochrome b561 [Acerihabitans sp. TG2]|nr:cytochrome b561 [Acerihabitans sp. TG2]MEA9393270.1 cytochrome b561 [Acerihabitans sp. TG2]
MKNRYGSLQIFFHWTIFILIVVTYAAMELKGFAARGGSLRATLLTVHYTTGVSVMLLMLVRVVAKWFSTTPDIVPAPARWQMFFAKLIHIVLYIMFIGLPLLGVLSLYFGGKEWTFFSYTMPVTDAPDGMLQFTLKDLHELIANTGYFIIGLHALAALFHHYVVRDNTLIRMLPGRREKLIENSGDDKH